MAEADPPPGRPVASPTPRLLGSIEGSIGWLVFNKPDRHNALSRDMWEGLPPLLNAICADPAVRVIVLRGAGERAFISGADISEFETERATPEAVDRYDVMVDDTLGALARCDRPTIAMIRGHCMGGGLALAAVCDLRLAADDSGFAIPAAKLSVGYRLSALETIVALVGPSFAKEILFTARRFDAAEALAMGLVNRVVPVDQLEILVRHYAETISANAPLTIDAAKRMIAALGAPGGPDHAACDALIERCFHSADYVEGRRAFMEKRKPKFTGR